MENVEMAEYTRSITTGEFQRQCFDEVLDLLKQLRIKESKEVTFIKREPTALLTYLTLDDLYQKCKQELEELTEIFSQLKDTLEGPLLEILDEYHRADVNCLQLLDTYGTFSELKVEHLDIKDKGSHTYLEISASKSHVFIRLSMSECVEDPLLKNSLLQNHMNKQYLADIMRLCKDARERKRDFRTSEMCGIWSGYSLIKKGTTLDFAYQGLGTSGFRRGHHTLIFTTDPGDDHIRITSRSNEMMDGIAAHVEHIDRDKVSSKELVEAYRLPAAINAAKVRLHIGDSVPVTAFIGRPVFENGNSEKNKPTENYEMDKLKSVHMSASACSTMFQNGMADCKLAIERMYLKDAVSFMKSVVGNVLRTMGRQTLAAAFNINTPYYDNLYHPANEDGTCYVLTDRYEIAKMAIKVATEGGFDRVTWDGASDRIPSEPIIDQLTHVQFTTLVHMAHENGLQTYFSAGLEGTHVERCIYTGVDGLGIGTSLHFIDPETKLMGAFDAKAIDEVLSARTRAESTVKGQAAILLARMDRLHYEQILSTSEEKLRNTLFEIVCNQEEVQMKAFMEDERLSRIIEIEESDGNTIVNRGKRTLSFMKKNEDEYSTDQIQKINKAIGNGDIETLRTMFAQRRRML